MGWGYGFWQLESQRRPLKPVHRELALQNCSDSNDPDTPDTIPSFAIATAALDEGAKGQGLRQMIPSVGSVPSPTLCPVCLGGAVGVGLHEHQPLG